MKSRPIPLTAAVLGGLFLATVLVAADQDTFPVNGDKQLVTDGHVRHDVGALHNHVTNWGLIGSRPSVPSPYSLAPSARWGGSDYLFAAGAWFGGRVLGEELVTTGQFATEFMATDAPADTIYATAKGAPGGNRYPWPGADDDGDGAEDEDPLDGLDNDTDGQIDEDFAAISDQHFRCAMADNVPLILDIYPDHTPLNLAIVQESFQWAEPLAADFIGYEYRVTNIGVTDIEDFHCGLFSDFDIGAAANDDITGSTVFMYETPWGWVPVSLGWMRDGVNSSTAPGWVAFVLCGVATDAASGGPENPLEMLSYQRFSGNAPFENGGDPTNDAERYELLSTPGRDPDSPAGMTADFRILLSTPAVTTVAPGETVTFRFALAIGDSYEDMLENAAEAVVTALGRFYDRDGDPANGDEFHVPWIRPDDGPVPAITGRLQAALQPDAVSLAFDVRHAGSGQVEVARREATGVPPRRWPVTAGSGTIVDTDPAGWPRTYDLLVKAGGSDEVVLDSVDMPGPDVRPLRLAARPNPFNPRLTIEYVLPAAGSARLEVLDLQGRVVRVLFDEPRPMGTHRIDWDGLDRRGRAAASGVYLMRLMTPEGAVKQQVTLLR